MTKEQLDAIRARVESGHRHTGCCAVEARENLRTLLAEVERLTAEVEMLRGIGCMEDGDGPCGVCRKRAFARGVAAMREAVVKSVTCHFPTINAGGNCGLCTFCDAALDKRIRALPDPEDNNGK